jgi:hypothetical protein
MRGVDFRKGSTVPQYEEVREIALVCEDCPREFMGEATYTIHTVEDSDQPVDEGLNRVLSTCPSNPFHRIRLKDS